MIESPLPQLSRTPALPEPDQKDWTWVLHTRCEACGFDAAAVDRSGIGAAVIATLPRWREALTRADAVTRPAPQVWSTVEYGCHVRDVHAVFGARIRLMLDQDNPLFDNWNQDETALAGRYWEATPAAVTPELSANAERAAAVFEGLTGAQWDRKGRRSNGSEFTVESLGKYYLHDVVHHLHDVRG